jgi:uncharacterized protein
MIERRSLTTQGEAGKIRLSIPFNSWSEDLGGFRERIIPGAFKRSLDSSEEILALWSHDPNKPLAKRSNGTLTLSANETALTAEVTADETSWSEDARRSIAAGTVTGSSFGFHTIEDSWYRQGGEWRRDLRSVVLIELSPTVSAAYPQSTASAA